MIPLGWDEIEALGLGELRGAPVDDVVRGDPRRLARSPGRATCSSRSTPGPRFVDDALARGAATLVPHDQEAALAALARARPRTLGRAGRRGRRLDGQDVDEGRLGALCAAVTPTVAADASRNNELGLPLTVLRLEPETQVLVTEMGMRGLGQIAELCAIARPTLALVTSIGPEHLELVGTVEDVARANAEAIEALPAGGVAVVPADEPLLEPYLRGDVAARSIRALETIPLDASRRERSRRWSRWLFPLGGGAVPLELPFSQRHLAENVLAALTAYDALGLPARARAREARR